jgi:cytochrome b561
MCLRNTETQYGSVSKFLHWVVLLLVFAMLGYGSIMGYFPKPLKPLVYNAHKLTGLVVLCFAILFCVWSLTSIKPLYTNMRLWEKKLATYVRVLLYICLLAMPLSGWMMSTAAGKDPHLLFWEFSMPFVPLSKTLATIANTAHGVLAWFFFAIIVLHTIGALKHHLIDRNDILTRMLGIAKK